MERNRHQRRSQVLQSQFSFSDSFLRRGLFEVPVPHLIVRQTNNICPQSSFCGVIVAASRAYQAAFPVPLCEESEADVSVWDVSKEYVSARWRCFNGLPSIIPVPRVTKFRSGSVTVVAFIPLWLVDFWAIHRWTHPRATASRTSCGRATLASVIVCFHDRRWLALARSPALFRCAE